MPTLFFLYRYFLFIKKVFTSALFSSKTEFIFLSTSASQTVFTSSNIMIYNNIQINKVFIFLFKPFPFFITTEADDDVIIVEETSRNIWEDLTVITSRKEVVVTSITERSAKECESKPLDVDGRHFSCYVFKH